MCPGRTRSQATVARVQNKRSTTPKHRSPTGAIFSRVGGGGRFRPPVRDHRVRHAAAETWSYPTRSARASRTRRECTPRTARPPGVAHNLKYRARTVGLVRSLVKNRARYRSGLFIDQHFPINATLVINKADTAGKIPSDLCSDETVVPELQKGQLVRLVRTPVPQCDPYRASIVSTSCGSTREAHNSHVPNERLSCNNRTSATGASVCGSVNTASRRQGLRKRLSSNAVIGGGASVARCAKQSGVGIPPHHLDIKGESRG